MTQLLSVQPNVDWQTPNHRHRLETFHPSAGGSALHSLRNEYLTISAVHYKRMLSDYITVAEDLLTGPFAVKRMTRLAFISFVKCN
jgi:hypothetical protein